MTGDGTNKISFHNDLRVKYIWQITVKTGFVFQLAGLTKKNRNKTTAFWRRQIPDDQEDAVRREVLHWTRTTGQVKHTQTQLRTKVLLIPWAVQTWAG